MAVTSWIRRQFKDGVIATATTTMTNVATSFSVGSGQGATFPDGSVGPFIVTVDQGQAAEEKILVQSRTSDTFTVATNGRGYNGTTAQAHTNAVVLHTIDAQDLDEANQAAVATLGAIQASGDLLQGSGANGLQRLARGTTGQFLQAGASLLGWVGFGVGQSTAVTTANADGSATTPARSDHAHQGVASLTAGTGVAVTGGDSSGHGALTVAASTDSTAADYTAVAQATAAGSTGKVADAGHAHQGVTSVTAGTGIGVTGGDGSGHGAITVAISATPAARLLQSAPQSIPNAGATQVTSLAQSYVYGDATTATNGITIHTAGLYRITAQVQWATPSGNVVQAYATIVKNGTGGMIGGVPLLSGAINGSSFVQDDVQCVANDVITLNCFQSSGGALSTVAAGTYLSVAMVSR